MKSVSLTAVRPVLLAEFPVINTLNLDKPIIDFNNEILSDRALDNNIVPNLNDEKVVMVGSYSSVVNAPPLIDKNTPGCSKHCHTSDLYSSSVANALHLVLSGSPELKKYDMEKHLFKLGKASLDTVNSLKYSLAKFQQQFLKKVSTLEVQFGNWERSFLSENNFCVPIASDVEDNSYNASIFSEIRIGTRRSKLHFMTQHSALNNTHKDSR